MDLALFWAAFISVLVQSSSGGKEEALALNVLLPIYTAGRLVYAVAYARGLQPLRTICFATSTSCTVAAAGVLLSSASKAYMLLHDVVGRQRARQCYRYSVMLSGAC